MSATQRLYYNDSRLLEFDARVIDLSERDDGAIAVVLDRTAFYPTGGGQPNDTGTLGGARVVDCIDAEDDGVLHVIQGPAPEVGDTVHGHVDWLRRLDQMQQHTGQHILSAAFVKLFDAPTRSFRVLEHECEIDVALENPSDEKIERAVDLANQIIWAARPIEIRNVTADEAATLPLRKEPAREGELRLIQIEDFDLTPCGGTHARSTGEVGVIAVRSWERAKGLARIQFMAGVRVLADYHKANRTAGEVAELFSASRDDSSALVGKLIDENKKLTRRVRELDEIASHVEAEELLRGSSPTPGSPSGQPAWGGAVREGAATVITKIFDDRAPDSLKHLALALIAHPNVVALLGSRDGDTARLVFARSSEASGDMNALMRKACEMIDGRGGGKPDMAQGGGKNVAAIDRAIEAAVQSLV
ncbi:MAG TPA: DHHA1 domain-containing protein [Pyrinomonadaceae bacterium]|nr:DHHA1 domain-containing protein [Pyrinomonadaceae bacterium]